jgi:hypothetical protein
MISMMRLQFEIECPAVLFPAIGLWAGHFAFVERWSSWPARASSFGPGFKKRCFATPLLKNKMM